LSFAERAWSSAVAMKEQAFKPTIGLTVFAGFLMGYWSFLAEASYTAITIRVGGTMAALGLLSWLFVKVMDGTARGQTGKALDLADLMGSSSGGIYDSAARFDDQEDELLDEEDDEESLTLEPLDSAVARI
jgi:hypothetical protein